MAGRSNRVLIGLVCEECGRQNYVTEKNKVNSPDKVSFKKYCKKDKKITVHKEKVKLK